MKTESKALTEKLNSVKSTTNEGAEMTSITNPDLTSARRGKYAVTEYIVRDGDVSTGRIIGIFRELEDARDFALYLRDRYGDIGDGATYRYEIETAKNAGLKTFA